MSTQRYAVNQPPIETLFTWIKSGEIAIPEIQRPFVWDATKVRDLLDSLLEGFPVGYIIAWKNPNVRLKDGTSSSGKRILIDGQQRITALMAALLGREIVNKNYEKVRIRIAYHPQDRKFEVHNPAIAKDDAWLPDVAVLFAPGASLFDTVRAYGSKNKGMTEEDVFRSLEALKGITNNQIGLIELDHDLDIETVNEIFIRVNSAGVPLSQADFAMSKIAVNETYGGNDLRKAIDYFCHLSVSPEFYQSIKENDPKFAATEYFQKMAWLRNDTESLYDPSYTDMLRVAFTSQFRRGKISDLVALLSGRNFETKLFEESIVESSFISLRSGILKFINETHFKRFVMIIRSAGFVTADLIGSKTALDFAYVLYLTLREQKIPDAEIERHVRRWFAMSIMTGRYSGSPESTIDTDIRGVHDKGIEAYSSELFQGLLSDAFWTATLPQELETSSRNSPAFSAFLAAQVKAGDKGFLSKDITVRELLEVKSDLHHVYPKSLLKNAGSTRGTFNQVANFVVAQTEINLAIGNEEPREYFAKLAAQAKGGPKKFGNIASEAELQINLAQHCIPGIASTMTLSDYPQFLAQRRRLMGQKLKDYFSSL